MCFQVNPQLEVLLAQQSNGLLWPVGLRPLPLSSCHPTDIMVQEFVKCGALDLYLRRTPSVCVSWKLEVAKQLACALNCLVRHLHEHRVCALCYG